MLVLVSTFNQLQISLSTENVPLLTEKNIENFNVAPNQFNIEKADTLHFTSDAL